LQYIIGIDGGGTKTEAVLAGAGGVPVEHFTTGPSNPHTVTFAQTEARLAEIVDHFLARPGVSPSSIRAICAGIAGVAKAEELHRAAGFLENYAAERSAGWRIFIRNDAEIAIMAAAGVPHGMIAISGTGSIVYGITPEGETARVGGWGHLLGDEGSGYAVGLKTLQAAMQSYDGVLPGTMLVPMIAERLSLSGIDGLKSYIYRPEIGKRNIAEFAALCIDAAGRGDETARRILETAARELAVLALALRRKQPGLAGVPIALSGSMFTRSPIYRQSFERRIRSEAPDAVFLLAGRPAAEGAARLALHLLRQPASPPADPKR